MKSKRILNMTPSATIEITAVLARMKAEGKDVIGMNIGEPDLNTPVHVIDACTKAMLAGHTKYTPVAGVLPLRESISKKLLQENGVKYSPDNIVVSTGAKQALNNAVMALCNPGDEVIILKPCYVSYVEIVKLADAVPVLVETKKGDFQIDLHAIEKAITPKTRAIIINTPNNPCGTVYSESDLRKLGDLAIEHDFYVISDEVYEKFIYGAGKHVCIASLGEKYLEHSVVVNGFSKAYAMTGWRIGYSASAPDVAAAIRSLQGHTTSNSTSFVQWASIAALEGPQQFVDEMKSEFAKRRETVLKKLRSMSGIECPESEGAFYLMPDVSSFYGKKTPEGKEISNSVDLCTYLLENALIAVIPGAAFESPDNIRISYSNSMEKLEEGMLRMGEALEKIK